MSKLPNGRYGTVNGSTIEISGKHGGISKVDFDWFEEPDACSECEAEPYPQYYDGKFHLAWNCDECGGGSAGISTISPMVSVKMEEET